MKKIAVLLTAAALAVSLFSAGSVLAEEGDVITDTWIESEGTWSYTVGENPISNYNQWLELSGALSEDMDWSKVMYVSANVTVTGKANLALQGSEPGSNDYFFDNSFILGTESDTSGSNGTFILKTNGKTLDSLGFNFWEYETSVHAAANSVITVSNVEFHETYDGLKNEWINTGDTYRYETDEAITGYSVSLDLSEKFPLPEDTSWTDVKYVTAEVAVEKGKACPVLEGSTSKTFSNSPTIESGENATLTLITNGVAQTSFRLNFWNCEGESNLQIAANSIVTIGNVHYYTDYNSLYDMWFSPEPNTYRYQVGGKNCMESVNTWFSINDTLTLPEGKTWSDIMYISAYATVDGQATPALEIDKLNYYNGTYLDNKSTTFYCVTGGKRIDELGDIALTFWADENSKIKATADSVITVTLQFHTDYEGLYDQWCYNETEDTYYYADSEDGEEPYSICNPFLTLEGTDVISTPCYVSANIEIEGTIGAFQLEARYGDNGTPRRGTEYYKEGITDAKFTAYMYLYDGTYDQIYIGGWSFSDGIKITISDFEIHPGTIPKEAFTKITGEWVQTGATAYYYKAGANAEQSAISYLPKPANCEWANVQTVTFMGYKVTDTVVKEKESDVVLTTLQIDGYNSTLEKDVSFDNINFPEGEENASTIEKKVRGQLHENVLLRSYYSFKDMEVYITDITYNTTTVPNTELGPNDIFVDDTTYYFLDEKDVLMITAGKVESAITTPGELRLYMKPNSHGTSNAELKFNDWSSGVQEILASFTVTGDKDYYTYEVTDEFLRKMETSNNLNGYNLLLYATGVDYEKTVFIPTPDASMPQVDTEASVTGKADELDASANYIVDEYVALSQGDFYSSVSLHAFGQKKQKEDNKYSYRLIQRFKKSALQNAKCFKITVHSQKHNKYITYTIDSYFDYLNIDGYRVDAKDGFAFAALILDGITGDDVITFTNFEIVYNE